MLLLGRFLVPKRKPADADVRGVGKYLFELKVTEESEVIGTTLGELRDRLANEGDDGGKGGKGGKRGRRNKNKEQEPRCDLLMLKHKDKRLTKVYRRHEIAANDLLIMHGSHEDIERIAIREKFALLPANSIRDNILESGESQIMEVVIAPQSSLIGRTADDVGFRSNHSIDLLAVSRAGDSHNHRLRQFQFRAGDVLLLHDDEEDDDLVKAVDRLDCYPLAGRTVTLGRAKAMLTLGICLAAVMLAAADVVSIQLAFGLVTVLMAAFKVVPMRSFYEGVEWPVVVLLGAMIPLGAAMETTGTSALLVEGIVALAADVSPVFIIVLILVVTMTISDVLNNAATAILMLPIAYNTALGLGLNPDPFLMAVAIGASCAFLTPIGHQNNALIMGPGGYRFTDYWPAGLPLEIVIVTISVPLLLIVWPM